MCSKRLVKIKIKNTEEEEICSRFNLEPPKDERFLTIEVPDDSETYKYLSTQDFILNWEFLDQEEEEDYKFNIREFLNRLKEPVSIVEQVGLILSVFYEVKKIGDKPSPRIFKVSNPSHLLDKYNLANLDLLGIINNPLGKVISDYTLDYIVKRVESKDWNNVSVNDDFDTFVKKII